MRILFYLLIIGLVSSCSKDDSEQLVEVKGRIINEITNEGIKGAPISVFVEEYYSDFFGGFLDIDNKSGFTDDNGNFSFSVKYSNQDNYFSFFSEDEFNTTDILGRNDRFLFDEAKSGDLIFKVRRKGKLKITLKNLNPFDEHDSVSFSIFQDLGYNPTVYEINNYGVENESIEGYELNPHWIGMNVDSTIYSTLEEGHTYQLTVHTTKNGIETNYVTPQFETSISEMNEYTLEY